MIKNTERKKLMNGKIVKRNQKLAFYGIKADDGSVTYRKMKGFTDISVSKNPKEYSRQYIDEITETTDVISYSPTIDFSFDMFTENDVHLDIEKVFNEELIGSDAVKSVVIVDFTKPATDVDGAYEMLMRDFALIPDTEGKGTEFYQYSGTFKAKGDVKTGYAVSEDDFETCVPTVR